MLSLDDGRRTLSRRQLLTIGSLGLGALGLPSLSLPSLLAARAAASDAPRPLTGRSVIFLFQQGGPSQFETFDPKLDAPEGVRTVTPVVQTSLPGVFFAEPMAPLAKLAHKLTIVRSFQTNNAGHNLQPIVGPDSLETNIGVHYARIAGPTRPATGMPTNAVLLPNAVSSDVPKSQARGNLSATGTYGAGFAPFVPGAGGDLQKDMQLNLPRGRLFEDRLPLLAQLDRLGDGLQATGQLKAMNDLQQQACAVLLGGGVANALDLSKEDARTVARYDTSDYAQPGAWDKVSRGKQGMYTAEAKTIGKLLLLARRLCEAGCGYVTIHAGSAGVWDMHADGNNLNMAEGMEAVGRSFAHAVAAFVEDLEARGLKDKILLVATGEMGRTPKINNRGGRDHWAKLAPLLLYGGGVDEGRVIGRSTRDGGEPASDNLTPKHLISTILHTVFDIGQLRLIPAVPALLTRLTQEPPISRF